MSDTQSDSIKELIMALSKVQSKLQSASKNQTNPFFNSNYADLSSVWDACRDLLSENSLVVIQTTGFNEDKIHLVTTLAHTSGEWISGKLPLLLTKKDAQGMGSAMTYARRYGLSAIVGLSQADDDGNSAVIGDTKKKKPTPKPTRRVKKNPYDLAMGYEIPFGKKYKGKKLSEITTQELVEYSHEVEQHLQTNKIDTAGYDEFFSHVEATLKGVEVINAEVGI